MKSLIFPQDNIKDINALPLVLSNREFPNDGVSVAGVYFTTTNAYVNLISRNTQEIFA
ncbi:MAG: hypothetical protein IPO78_13460 [Saprospiraceae bacterium]|nr:hypothetical protein [Saprospiraceae bacterium]